MIHPAVEAVRPMKIKQSLLLLLCISAGILKSQTSDFQLWNAVELKQDLPKGFDLSLQYQSRFDKDITRFRGSYISVAGGYKLNKTFSADAGLRFSTSSRWDRLRYSAGISGQWKKSGWNFSAKFKYQYQFYLAAMPENGINPPAHNLRLKLGAEHKITKKLKAFLSSEPLYRIQESEGYLRRIRNTAGIIWSPIKRMSFEAAYIWQPQWNSARIVHIAQFNIAYDLPKIKKRKNTSTPVTP